MNAPKPLPPGLETIRTGLLQHRPALDGFKPSPDRAAVSLIFAGPPDGLAMAFIRRAEREGDPWSGHIAFPGGRAQSDDADARAVAERETLEEIGIGLGPETLLGALGVMPIRLAGKDTGMTLYPFVYYLGGSFPPFLPNHEIVEGFWAPLQQVWNLGNQTELTRHYEGETYRFPAIQYNGHTIWGLTHRVLLRFTNIIASPLPGGHDADGF